MGSVFPWEKRGLRIPLGGLLLIVLSFKGRLQDAREHFVWVRDYGNKRFIEYALALAELGRM
jgi:hypothetical protein